MREIKWLSEICIKYKKSIYKENTMEKLYLEKFRKDLTAFREMTEKFYNKEITVVEYKGFSGGFGSYAQRGGERSMLRLRMAGGEVDKEKLKFVADSIEKYNIDKVHLTTCQTIQLHNLTKNTVCQLVEEAWEHGIITRGGGGDYPRNVMCSPLSGVNKEEVFDVLPFAKEAGNYLLGLIGEVKLPRKLKVCFSNNNKNEVHATFRDLGFIAKENGSFDVYIAGGLGIKPKFGVKVVENIEPSKVLFCIKTMVDIFTEHGNYENRAASRTRYLQETLGVEELKKLFQEKLAQNLSVEKLELDLVPESFQPKKKGTTTDLKHARVIAQKQEGLYAVSYHPVGGIVAPEFFQKLHKIIVDMDEVKVRLTPAQGMYIINLTAKEAEKVLEITKDGAETIFERSTACIGADICQQGIGLSQALLKACVERVRKENFADGVLPAIYISGCPSSCGAHQTAAIGLRGGKKPSPEGPKFAFAVYENGCQLEGEERFGQDLGIMYEEQIPEFFVELGRAVEAEGMSYEEFRNKYPEKIREIATKYI